MSRTNLKEQVRKVLSENISTRNSDEELTIKVWQTYYEVQGDTINIRRMFSLPTHKDIARHRAQIQNKEHQYIPTVPGVAKARKWNEQVWRELLGYPVYNPEKPVEIKKVEPVVEPKKPDLDQSKLFDVEPPKHKTRWFN